MIVKIAMFFLAGFLAVFLVGMLGVGIARTLQVEATPNQSKFINGTGEVILDGFYKGSVNNAQGNWQGKTFRYSQSQTGINNFKENGKEVTKYPFRTSIRKGLRDPIKVVQVDYNIPANPIWVRPLLDEVVQVDENKYLGKIHYRILPGFPFTIGFFELHKVDN